LQLSLGNVEEGVKLLERALDDNLIGRQVHELLGEFLEPDLASWVGEVENFF
jgi:hypothetical protein